MWIFLRNFLGKQFFSSAARWCKWTQVGGEGWHPSRYMRLFSFCCWWFSHLLLVFFGSRQCEEEEQLNRDTGLSLLFLSFSLNPLISLVQESANERTRPIKRRYGTAPGCVRGRDLLSGHITSPGPVTVQVVEKFGQSCFKVVSKLSQNCLDQFLKVV